MPWNFIIKVVRIDSPLLNFSVPYLLSSDYCRRTFKCHFFRPTLYYETHCRRTFRPECFSCEPFHHKFLSQTFFRSLFLSKVSIVCLFTVRLFFISFLAVGGFTVLIETCASDCFHRIFHR